MCSTATAFVRSSLIWLFCASVIRGSAAEPANATDAPTKPQQTSKSRTTTARSLVCRRTILRSRLGNAGDPFFDRSGLADQPVGERPAGGLGAVRNPQLAVDVGQVELDRLLGHPQLFSERLVGKTTRNTG